MKSFGILAISFFYCASISAEACSFAPIIISSHVHGKNKTYFGVRPEFSVSWEDIGEPSDHLTVKNLKTEKTCDLKGWPLNDKEMYLSSDGTTFMLVDGVSDDTAEFYKLDTCERVARADITAEPGEYFVSPNMIGTYGYCDGAKNLDGALRCEPAAIYMIGDDCMPHFDADKSAAITKMIFGVVFTKPSYISHLGTAKATAAPDTSP